MKVKEARKTVAESFPATYTVYTVAPDLTVEATKASPSELFLDRQYAWTKSSVGLPGDDQAFLHAIGTTTGNTPLVGSELWIGYDKSTLKTDRTKGTIPAGSIPVFMIGPVGLA